MSSEMFVSPFLTNLLGKLSSLIHMELLVHLHWDLWNLRSVLDVIHAVLPVAEEKQMKDKAIKDWLGILQAALYDAEDLVEELQFEALERNLSGFRRARETDSVIEVLLSTTSSHLTSVGKTTLAKLVYNDAEDLFDELEFEALKQESQRPNLSCTSQVSNSLSARFDFKKRIKTFEEINSLGVRLNVWRARESVSDRESSCIQTEPIVFGRARETESIIQVLLNPSYHLTICPIVGIGGLGKTTLAQLVYNDERVANTFEIRNWISVPKGPFNIKRIMETMIHGITGRISDLQDFTSLYNLLQDLLKGRKYLLVLDDVWVEDTVVWERLINLLACGGKGSAIIVTSRLQTVVTSLLSLQTSSNSSLCVINPIINLERLLEDDSWSLFKRYAFGAGCQENQNLVEIGKEVVKMCGGLPLAIKAVGNLLNSKSEEFWRLVRDGELRNLEEYGENTLVSSLRLSYERLPPHIRQCFAHCSVYPKRMEIQKNRLIHEWIANGFIRSSKGLEAEDIGEEIISQLVSRSFFQNVEENWLGIKICKVEDFMHALAYSVAQTECVALEEADQLARLPKSVRHLSVSDGAQSSGVIDAISKSLPHLRTCIFPPMNNPPLSVIFENLTCLRTLHLEGTNISNLPNSIENMKHLRYLNLSSSTNLKLLPESICSLIYLQTLEMSECGKLQKLPNSINKLINLRHMYLSDCRSLTKLPDGFGELINLRHLDLSECDEFIDMPDVIGRLENLRHLDLHDCEKLFQLPDAIGQLLNLRYLDISRCPNLNRLPNGIGKLINLRQLNLSKLHELTRLPVLEALLGSDRGLSIRDLHGLNLLEGELQLRGLEHVKDGREAMEANLVGKANLSSLSLVWGDLLVDQNNSEGVIYWLQPHQNLKKLVIEAYKGSLFPTWVSRLPNVVEIQLSHCSECEDLPPLGHLPFLRKLCISGMDSLKCISKKFYGIATSSTNAGRTKRKGFFPSLEELEFRELRNWEKWQVFDDEKVFLCLKKLRLHECPKLAFLPLSTQHSAAKFEISKCEKLTMRTLPI